MLDGEEMDEGLSVPLRQAIRRNPNSILLPRRHLRLQKFVEKLVDFARKQSDVWVFSNGRAENVDPVMVAGDGTITAGTCPQTKEFNGGFTVLDVPSREAAWSGPRRSRPPAAVLERSTSSCPIQRWATG